MFKSCEGEKTHRMLACVNVTRFTVKGDQSDETVAGVSYCSSQFYFQLKSSCLWVMQKTRKNMFDSRWEAELKRYHRHIFALGWSLEPVLYWYKCLTTRSPGNKKKLKTTTKNMICSSYQFPLYKYSYRSQFQATNLTSFNTDRERNVKHAPGHQSITFSSCNPICFTWMGHSTEWQETDQFLFQKKNYRSVVWVLAHTGSWTTNAFPYSSLHLVVLRVSVEVFLASNSKARWGPPPTTLQFLPR